MHYNTLQIEHIVTPYEHICKALQMIMVMVRVHPNPAYNYDYAAL